MSTPAARLLVALKPREVIDAVLSERLLGVPWRYAEGAVPSELGSVEVLLVGSVERELRGFDPRATPRLAFVQRIYTGLDGLPFERFPESVRFAGNVGGFAPYVAEHAVALALGASHELLAGHRLISGGRLRPAPAQLALRGKTALILGYGAIGREIARRLEPFGIRRVGLNRSGRMAAELDAAYPADKLEEALAEADLVFDVRPLTRATKGSLGAGQLNRMRPDAVYVNVGRAGTVDEAALFDHLKTHPGFRAAMDVWWSEDYVAGTLETRFPWRDLPNFLGSPHSASSYPGAEEFALRRAVENVARYFRGETPAYLADRREYLETGSPGGP
jgi:phosphoglycerate dehydrogenase-like enzyme